MASYYPLSPVNFEYLLRITNFAPKSSFGGSYMEPGLPCKCFKDRAGGGRKPPNLAGGWFQLARVLHKSGAQILLVLGRLVPYHLYLPDSGAVPPGTWQTLVEYHLVLARFRCSTTWYLADSGRVPPITWQVSTAPSLGLGRQKNRVSPGPHQGLSNPLWLIWN